MYKELKTEISSLAKQLQDLSEEFAKEKNAVEDLKSSLSVAMKRIGNLENPQPHSQHGQKGQSSRSTPADHMETNRQFLKTLSWEQVITYIHIPFHSSYI